MSFGVPGPRLWDTFLSWVLLLSFNTYLSAAAVLSSFSIVVQLITFRNVIEMDVDPVFLEHLPCCGGHVHKLFSQ